MMLETLVCRSTVGLHFQLMSESTLSRLKLPKFLEREPLLDAVFEVRFGGNPHIADIVPGVLFGQLTSKPEIQRLPAAEIPQPIRAGDPNLMFAPTIRLDFDSFTISIGDNNIIIACKLPYPKWPRFKEEILDMAKRISGVGIAGPVVRYSIKFVNLIEAPTIAAQIQKIDMSLRLGDVEAVDDHISVQVHRREGETLHLMSIVTSASAQMHDRRAFGVIVDIDSIRNANFPNFYSFAKDLEPALDSLRYENKAKFFGCLKPATIDEMGPKYD